MLNASLLSLKSFGGNLLASEIKQIKGQLKMEVKMLLCN
jgi:hypothetical protein